jgi:hypothetical protein
MTPRPHAPANPRLPNISAAKLRPTSPTESEEQALGQLLSNFAELSSRLGYETIIANETTGDNDFPVLSTGVSPKVSESLEAFERSRYLEWSQGIDIVNGISTYPIDDHR